MQHKTIESIQSNLGTAQQRLSCVEDTVVDLLETPSSATVGRARASIARTIAALQQADNKLAKLAS